MELDALIIADAVSTPPDDKFYIHGGGFSRYEVPLLPHPIPLGVLLRLRVHDEDLTRTHKFGVALIGPLGVPNVPAVEFEATPPAVTTELAEGEEQFANIALQIGAVAMRAGLYHLEVHINGELARRVPLPVVLVAEQPAAPSAHEWPEGAARAPSRRASTSSSAKAKPVKAKRPPPKRKRRR